MEKENPEKAETQAFLREYVVESFLKKGIHITLQELVETYREVCPEYAKQLTAVLGLLEFPDK